MGKSIPRRWFINLEIIVEKPDRQLKCLLKFIWGQTSLLKCLFGSTSRASGRMKAIEV